MPSRYRPGSGVSIAPSRTSARTIGQGVFHVCARSIQSAQEASQPGRRSPRTAAARPASASTSSHAPTRRSCPRLAVPRSASATALSISLHLRISRASVRRSASLRPRSALATCREERACSAFSSGSIR